MILGKLARARATVSLRRHPSWRGAGYTTPAPAPTPTSEVPKPRGASAELKDASAGATKTAKSMAERDDEVRRKLEEMSGEGGASGVETEDGKPATMKRAVRNNMFRYI